MSRWCQRNAENENGRGQKIRRWDLKEWWEVGLCIGFASLCYTLDPNIIPIVSKKESDSVTIGSQIESVREDFLV